MFDVEHGMLIRSETKFIVKSKHLIFRVFDRHFLWFLSTFLFLDFNTWRDVKIVC